MVAWGAIAGKAESVLLDLTYILTKFKVLGSEFIFFKCEIYYNANISFVSRKYNIQSKISNILPGINMIANRK